MEKRDFLSIKDLTKTEIEYLFSVAASLKKDETHSHTAGLKEKSVALVFQKPSNRTRVSFEIGIWQLGGKCVYLSPNEINLGKRESTSDVAKTLSRYVDCIVARTFSHDDTLSLAEHASVPVINGLSDLFHPCQALADLFTIKEKFKGFDNITMAWIGDGNNVCNSLLWGCSKVGLNIAIATPKKYEPDADIVEQVQQYAKNSGSQITLTCEPQQAATGASVLYTDVWTSMGQEAEQKQRLKDFKRFQINAELANNATSDYIFMHCLPAHRGQEVTEEIIDSDHSVVFDQAENRMHIQKAILLFLLKKK